VHFSSYEDSWYLIEREKVNGKSIECVSGDSFYRFFCLSIRMDARKHFQGGNRMFQKTVLFIITAALLCTLPIQAQVGVKGSLNLSDFHVSEKMVGSEAKKMAGFSGGLVFALPLNELFSFRGELIYSQKGQKYDIVSTEDAYVKTRLGYLELPLLLQINVPASSSVKPLFLAGGYGAYLLSAKMSGLYNEESNDVKDSFKKLDFGLIIGAGLQLDVGESGSILIDVRYNLGLSNINDIQESTTQMKNRGISFSAGFLF